MLLKYRGNYQIDYPGVELDFIKEVTYRTLYGLIDGSLPMVQGTIQKDLDTNFPGKYKVEVSDNWLERQDDWRVYIIENGENIFSLYRNLIYECEHYYGECWDYDHKPNEAEEKLYYENIQRQHGVKLFI